MDIRKPPPGGNGLDLGRQRAEESPNDWIFGALSQPGLVSIPEEERETWLPKGEVQGGVQDFADCASRSPNNHLEALFTYHYQHDMKPENKVWLEINGYVGDDKRVTFSDRWVAIGSNTTRTGNSLRGPIDFLRKGLIPKKMLPKEETMDWSAYHDPSKITQAMRNLADEFAKRFTINFEAVAQVHFSEVLKDDFLGVAGFAWATPIDGVYPPSDNQMNHAFLLYKNPKWQAFDNYLEAPDDYTKNLSPFYKFYETAYRVYLASEQVPTDEKKSVLSLYAELVKLLEKIRDLWAQVPPPQIPPPVIPPIINPPITPLPMPTYKWDTLANSRHSVRLICDEMLPLKRTVLINGKYYLPKDVITAVIQGESGFNNKAKCLNKNAQGVVTSTDWGICQINDKYHVGAGKRWSSVAQIVNNPDKAVKWMIQMYNQGLLKLWVAYSSGAYKKFLPQTLGSERSDLPIKQTNNMIDPQIISAITIVAITLFRSFGYDLDSGMLTEIVSAIGVLVSAAVIWYQRTTLVKGVNNIGDVNFAGVAR